MSSYLRVTSSDLWLPSLDRQVTSSKAGIWELWVQTFGLQDSSYELEDQKTG